MGSNPIHTKTTNYLGGYTQVDTHLDWAGKTLYTLTKHKRTDADAELVVKDMFSYSPQDKLVLHKQQINALPEQLITKNNYDELGQLISKNVGGTDITGASGLQTVDYTYNIRGWLKAINDVNTIGNDLFAFKINYNDAKTATDLYNGNISETFWKTKSDNIKRKYDYTYDHLNRLLQADYSKEGSTTFNSYLEHLTYDKNGNIQSLLRNGDMDTDGMQFEQLIDELIYTYHPQNKNQLMKVIDSTNDHKGFKDDSDGITDTTDDYVYDLNGNMISDTNKGITNISYNHLNLPVEIVFPNGKINYLYNATGQKVKKTVTEGTTITTTDYLAGFQYKNAVLQFFPHAEGYVNATPSGTSYVFNYVYNFTDHLGNIRLSYSKDPLTNVLKIIEENHYYPFGLKHSGYNSDKMLYVKEGSTVKIRPLPPLFKTVYDKKYNGKSWETELGLNFYDYGARNYDPALGRWMNIDPLAEKYYNVNPYTYAVNNPVFFIDPDGMQVDTDYKVIKKGEDKGMIVRVDPNDGSEKNATDRILKTDKNGNVKTETKKNDDGTKSEVAKVDVDNIAKGIISEGMNFRTENYTIAFGGEGQPTHKNVIDFLVQFSENVANSEIAGFEAIGDSNRSQNYITTYMYKDNDFQKSYSQNYRYAQKVSTDKGTIIIMAHYHTHPSNTGLPDDIDEPSEIDIEAQKGRRKLGIQDFYIYNIHGRINY